MIETKFEGSETEALLLEVENWFESLPKVADGTEKLELLEPNQLQTYLTFYGADFEARDNSERQEILKKLKQSTNEPRRPGMDAVWGQQYIDNFNKWTTNWANKFEEITGKRLPRLEKSKNRTSGMRHFLGELTAYAGGYMPLTDFRKRLTVRLQNGRDRYQGMSRKDLLKANWLADDKHYPGSIPPGYVAYAVGAIRSQSFKYGVPGIVIPQNTWRIN